MTHITSAMSTCCAASNLLPRADNMAKYLVVSSRDGEGQLENSRESGAQVEEMTRAWQEVSAAGSLLQSPSLAMLAATPAPGKLTRALTHTHLRSTVEELTLRVLRKTEETLQWFLFLFFLSVQTFQTK